MNRFFIPEIILRDDFFVFSNSDQVRQIGKVLRLRSGETVAIFDGTGKEIVLKITEVAQNSVLAKKIEERCPEKELGLKINLYQAVISRDKFELIIKAATELGVSSVVPVKASRSQPFSLNFERFKKIIIEATEQSGRTKLPEIKKMTLFNEALLQAKSGIIAWENESENSLKDIPDNDIIKNKEVNLFVGPEGGFTDEEIKAARKLGFKTFSMGRRILRAETAAIAAVSIIASRI